MKKILLIGTSVISMLISYSQVSISGPQSICQSAINYTNYSSNYTLTGWSDPCKNAYRKLFKITATSNLRFNNSATSLNLYTTANSVSFNVRGNNASNSILNEIIYVTVECLNESNQVLNSLTNSYNIKVTPKWNTYITGNSSPENAGQYTYTVVAASGATQYFWQLPPNYTCISGCNSNSISVYISPNAMPGSIKVNHNSSLVCQDEISKNISIDECFNKTRGEYDGNKVSERMVSGDFDNDGREDDIAGLYYYENFNSTMHVWKSDGTSLAYQGDNGWWLSNSYDATKVTGMVSGDFDRDGFNDDIALFYDYGGFHTRIHVLFSNGSSFSFGTLYTNYSYDAKKVKNRIVSGDFDRDGFKDDIAAFYDYGNSSMAIHLWQSTGSSFLGPNSSGWYTNSTYNVNNITGKVVSGDFDRDGYIDDLAAFYDYGNFETALHVWTSTGSAFTGLSTNGWYTNNTYDASRITGRVVSGDFNKDGFNDDISAIYAYDNSTVAVHVWKSTGSNFQGPSTNGWWTSNTYNANKLPYRVLSGNFTNSTIKGKNDIIGFYDYGNFNVAAHVWKSFSSYFSYLSDNGYWRVCNPYYSTKENNDDIPLNIYGQKNNDIKIYPNPASTYFAIANNEDISKIDLINNIGQIIKSYSRPNDIINIDNNITSGVYYIKFFQGSNIYFEKLVIQR